MSRIICIPLPHHLVRFAGWLVDHSSEQFIIYLPVCCKQEINHIWQLMASFVSSLNPNLLTTHGRLPQLFKRSVEPQVFHAVSVSNHL